MPSNGGEGVPMGGGDADDWRLTPEEIAALLGPMGGGEEQNAERAKIDQELGRDAIKAANDRYHERQRKHERAEAASEMEDRQQAEMERLLAGRTPEVAAREMTLDMKKLADEISEMKLERYLDPEMREYHKQQLEQAMAEYGAMSMRREKIVEQMSEAEAEAATYEASEGSPVDEGFDSVGEADVNTAEKMSLAAIDQVMSELGEGDAELKRLLELKRQEIEQRRESAGAVDETEFARGEEAREEQETRVYEKAKKRGGFRKFMRRVMTQAGAVALAALMTLKPAAQDEAAETVAGVEPQYVAERDNGESAEETEAIESAEAAGTETAAENTEEAGEEAGEDERERQRFGKMADEELDALIGGLLG